MIDFENPEVSTVVKGLKGKSIVIYGGNRTGKSSNCAKADKVVFLCFENGLTAVNGVRHFKMTKWTDWTDFVKFATRPATAEKAHSLYNTIVIDTIDVMLSMGEEYICNTYNIQSIDRDDDGTKSNGGHYKEYRAEVRKWVTALTNSGYTVIFLGHDDSRQLKDDRGEKYTKLYPKGDKKSVDMICDLSEIYYACARPLGEDGKEVKSTLYLKGTPAFLAGSRYTYMPECIEEWTLEKLEKTIADAISAEENATGMKADTFEESAAKEAKKAAEAKAQQKPIDELINIIGTKVSEMIAKDGNKKAYEEILLEDLGNPEFRAQGATEKQREQLETIVRSLEARGY